MAVGDGPNEHDGNIGITGDANRMAVMAIDVVVFGGISENSSGSGSETRGKTSAEVVGESVFVGKGSGTADCNREITVESDAIRLHGEEVRKRDT